CASGVCAATRPTRASSTRFCLETPTAQNMQWRCLGPMGAPHPEHILASRGAGFTDVKDEAPFASRLWHCVKRVAGPRLAADLHFVDQSSRANHSANGATARPHVGAVSD